MTEQRPMLGGIHHVALITSNLDRAIRFYSGILGLPVVRAERNPRDPDSRIYYFDLGSGNLLALFEFKNVNEGVSGVGQLHHVSLQVADLGALNAWHASLQAAGVGVSDVADLEFIHSFYLQDPDGVTLEITAQARALGPDDLRADPDPAAELQRLLGGDESP